jgi:uncharacterized protein (TIGR02594 family)
MIRIIGIALALVFAVTLSASPAEAKKKRHRVAPAQATSCVVTDNNPCSSFSGPWVERHVYVPVRAGGRKAWKAGKAISVAGSGLVERARAYSGMTAAQLGLPRSQWCADFMNKITGGGTGSRLARSWDSVGVASGPHVGAVAVMSRGKRGGHVGVVSDLSACGPGKVMIISGNHNRRVGEGCYPMRRIYAWRAV